MKEQTAQRAAKWWADQLRGPAKLDNGDRSEKGAMTAVLAMMLQDVERSRIDTDKISIFESELAKILQERNPFSFGVDYHPDHILSDAAVAAGIDLGMSTLPWKTSMKFNDDDVRVSCGYGADWVTV